MEELKQLMLEQFDKLNTKIDANNEKFAKLDEELRQVKLDNIEIKKEMDLKDGKIRYLENKIKENNLVLYGIQEEEHEVADALENKVVKVFQDGMSVEVLKSDISTTYRVGRETNGRTRPIIVKFLSQKIKKEVMDNKRNLKGSNIYINNDMNAEDRKEAQEARYIFKWLKAEGRDVSIRGSKLILDGKSLSQEEIIEIKQRREVRISLGNGVQNNARLEERTPQRSMEENVRIEGRQDGVEGMDSCSRNAIDRYFFRRRSPGREQRK